MARTRYARNGGHRIAFEVRAAPLGRRRLWLVLVQGLGFDRAGWGPVLRRLRRRFRLVLIDNRGIGRSSPADGGLRVADMASDVIAVMDAAGIRTAHLMGTSLGGMVAQEVAIAHPERIDRLVLVCTTPGWPFAYGMPAGTVRLMTETKGLSREVALRRHTENAMAAQTVEDRPELVEQVMNHQRRRPGDPEGFSAQAGAGARYSGRMRALGIRAKTLVVHGSGDRVVDPRNSGLLATRIPNAKLVLLPDRGHLLYWEDPAEFAATVIPFLLGDEPGTPTKPAALLESPAVEPAS